MPNTLNENINVHIQSPLSPPFFIVQRQIDELKHENDILHDELLKARILSPPSCNLTSLTASNKRTQHCHHSASGRYLSKSAPSSAGQSRMTRRPSELSVESITSDGIDSGISLHFDNVTDMSSIDSYSSYGKGKGRSVRREKSFDGYS